MNDFNMIAVGSTRIRQLVSQNIALTTLLGLALFGTLAAYCASKRRQRFWSRRGLRGPKPVAFIGNFLAQFRGNRLAKELDWVRQYGKVYGVFEGNTPRLIVADAEVLQQVCIKDFDTFPNHSQSGIAHKYANSFLLNLQDEHWRRTRALQSPTFTSSKIKRMFRFLDGCADDLIQCFRDQLAGPPEGDWGPASGRQRATVNVKDLYSLFTMDAITTCCYGLKLERAEGSTSLRTAASRNEFVANAVQVFRVEFWRLLVGLTLPDSMLEAMKFKMVPDRQLQALTRKVQQLVDQRRVSAKKFDDYLQLLIDARLDDQLELNEMDSAENHHAGLTHESLVQDQRLLVRALANGSNKRLVLSDFEILSSAIFLIVVGLDTTASLLAHCTYALAFHQEVQDRLYEELMKIAQFDTDKNKFYFDYESLTSCKYLDACLSETLRILPPVVQMDRKSRNDYHLAKYNLQLPKGSRLQLAYYAIMNDPDYWPQPERFNPNRFMPGERENIVPGSYCPFGLGPRHCLGMRFSLTEAKLALAKMVMNYRFEPAAGTKFPPEPKVQFLRGSNTLLGGLRNPLVTVSERK